MSKDIFISYANEDLKLAEKICEYLENDNKNCWIAPRDILPGKEYGEEIIRGIEECKAFVLIYSDESNHSQHVLREVERAVSKEVPIIVYKISNSPLTKSMEYFLLANQWLDATTNQDDKLNELSKSADKLLKEQKTQAEPKPAVLPPCAKPNIFKKFAKNKIAVIISVIAIGSIAVVIGLNSMKASAAFANNPAKSGGDSKSSSSISASESQVSQKPASSAVSASSNGAGGGNAIGTGGEAAVNSKESVQSSVGNIPVGSHVKFGRYYAPGYSESYGDSDIFWIVLNYDKSSGNAFMISEKILDIKPFDVAESGRYEYSKSGKYFDSDLLSSYSAEEMTEFKGNSDWERSNIRSWLNSDSFNVGYSDQAPIYTGTDELQNGYNKQKGFLYNFTSKEKSLIIPRTNTTPVNLLKQGAVGGGKLFSFARGSISAGWNFSGVMSKTTRDKVFLLSLDEVKRYMVDKGISIYTEATVSAAKSDKSTWYSSYESSGNSNYIWALRTPEGTKSYSVCLIGTGNNRDYDVISKNASASGLGIRPAMVINMKNANVSGTGSSSDPFKVS